MALYSTETIMVGDRADGFCVDKISTMPLVGGVDYLYLKPLKKDGASYRAWAVGDGAIDALVRNPCDASAIPAAETVTVTVAGSGSGPAERVLNDTNVPGITEAQAEQARIDSYPHFRLEAVHDQVSHEAGV